MTEVKEVLHSGFLEIREVQVPIGRVGRVIKASMPNMAKILAVTAKGDNLVFSLALEGPHEVAERDFFLYSSEETYNLAGAQFFVGAIRYNSELLYCFERC